LFSVQIGGGEIRENSQHSSQENHYKEINAAELPTEDHRNEDTDQAEETEEDGDEAEPRENNQRNEVAFNYLLLVGKMRVALKILRS